MLDMFCRLLPKRALRDPFNVLHYVIRYGTACGPGIEDSVIYYEPAMFAAFVLHGLG